MQRAICNVLNGAIILDRAVVSPWCDSMHERSCVYPVTLKLILHSTCVYPPQLSLHSTSLFFTDSPLTFAKELYTNQGNYHSVNRSAQGCQLLRIALREKLKISILHPSNCAVLTSGKSDKQKKK